MIKEWNRHSLFKRGTALTLTALTVITTMPSNLTTLTAQAATVSNGAPYAQTLTVPSTYGDYAKLLTLTLSDIEVDDGDEISYSVTVTNSDGSYTVEGDSTILGDTISEEDPDSIADDDLDDLLDDTLDTPSDSTDSTGADSSSGTDASGSDSSSGSDASGTDASGDSSQPVEGDTTSSIDIGTSYASIQDTYVASTASADGYTVQSATIDVSSQNINMAAGDTYTVSFTLSGSSSKYTVGSITATYATGTLSETGSITASPAKSALALGESTTTTAVYSVNGTSKSRTLTYAVSSGNSVSVDSSTGKITASSANTGASVITVSGGSDGNGGTASASFTVYVLNTEFVTTPDLTYTGSAQKPAVKVTCGSSSWTYDSTDSTTVSAFTADFDTPTYSNAVDATSSTPASVTVTGKGNYKDYSATLSYSIAKKNISSISTSAATFTIGTNDDGDYEVKASSGVMDGTREMTLGTDFTATIDSRSVTSARTSYDMTLTGTGNYTGTKSITYTTSGDSNNLIDINDLYTVNITRTDAEYPYVGSAIQPSSSEVQFISKETGATISAPSSVTITYHDANSTSLTASVGTKYMTITGINNDLLGYYYTGTIDVPYYVVTNDFDVNSQLSPTELGYVTMTVSGGDISADTFTYTGANIVPTVAVYVYNGTQLVEMSTSDYTTSTSRGDSKNISTDTKYGIVDVEGVESNCTGTLTGNFYIRGSLATDTIITIGGNSTTAKASNNYKSGYQTTYNGQAQEPSVSMTWSNKKTVSSSLYTVTYNNNVDADSTGATAEVIITGKAGTDYAGQTVTAYFQILPRTLTKGTNKGTFTGPADKVYDAQSVALDSSDYVLTQELYYSSAYHTETLVFGRDYYLAFTTAVSPTSAGTYTVQATGMGNYSGSLTTSFTITPLVITGNANVVIWDGVKAGGAGISDQGYTGSSVEPSIVVTYNGYVIPSEQYTVSYSNNVEVGSAATVTVTGKNNLTGSIVEAFNIVEKDITDLADTIQIGDDTNGYYGVTAVSSTSSVNTYSTTYAVDFDGYSIEPNVIIKNGGTTLTKDKDYTITYSNNINATSSSNYAIVTLTGKGNYTSSKTIQIRFNINKRNLGDYVNSGVITIAQAADSSGNKIYQDENGKYIPYMTVRDTGVATRLRSLSLYDESTATGDYTAVCTSGGTQAGTGNVVTLTATENSNYVGSATWTYTIGTQISNRNAQILLKKNSAATTYYDTSASTGNYQVEYLGTASDDSLRPYAVLASSSGTALNTTYDTTYTVQTDIGDSNGYAAGSQVLVTVTPSEGNIKYYGSVTATYDVTKLALNSSAVTVSLAPTSDGTITGSATSGYTVTYTYNGQTRSMTDDLVVTYNGNTLTYGTDYVISNNAAIAADANETGSAVLINGDVTGSSYTGTINVNAIVKKYDITNKLNYYIDEDFHDVTQTFYYPDTTTPIPSFDFPDTSTLNQTFYQCNDEAGRIYVSALPAIKYTGSSMTYPLTTAFYDSYGLNSSVTDMSSKHILRASTDGIALTWSNYNKVSSGTNCTDGVRATCKITTTNSDNYTGTLIVTYYIDSQTWNEISDGITYDNVEETYTYDGSAWGAGRITPYVYYKGTKLTEGTDYSVTYQDSTGGTDLVSPGQKQIKITALANNSLNLSAGTTMDLCTYDVIGNISDSTYFRVIYPDSKVTMAISEGTYKVATPALSNSSSNDTVVYLQRWKDNGDGTGSWVTVTNMDGLSLKFTDAAGQDLANSTRDCPGYVTMTVMGTQAAGTKFYTGSTTSFMLRSNIGTYYNGYIRATANLDGTLASISYTNEEYEFTGYTMDKKKPVVKVNGFTMSNLTDYTLTYDNGVDWSSAGTKNVEVSTGSNGCLLNTATATYYIVYNLADAEVTLNQTSYPYDGTAHTPSVTKVTVHGDTLTEGIHYTVGTPVNNTEAGTASMVLSSVLHKSINSKTATWTIQGLDISNASVTAYSDELEYNRKEQKPQGIEFTLAGKTLVEGVDYELVWTGSADGTYTNADLTNVGMKYFYAKGLNNYSGTKDLTYQITRCDISTLEPYVSIEDTYYGGYYVSDTTRNTSKADVYPTVSVKTANGDDLVEGTDFEVDYTDANLKTVGTSTLKKISGLGNYKGTITTAATLTYNVKPLDITDGSVVSYDNTVLEYNGKAQDPGILVQAYLGNKEENGKYNLIKDSEYTIRYMDSNNTIISQVTEIGTYYFQATAVGSNYTGDTGWVSFEVTERSIDPRDHTEITMTMDTDAHMDWNNGNPQLSELGLGIYDGQTSSTLVENTDYSLDIQDAAGNLLSSGSSLVAGYAKLLVSGIGNYGSTVTIVGVDASGNAVREYTDASGNVSYSGTVEKYISIGDEISGLTTKVGNVVGSDGNTTINLSNYNYKFNATEQKPNVTGVYRDGTGWLTKGTDYEIIDPSGADYKNAGNKVITITGKNGYFGTATAQYNIAKIQAVASNIRVDLAGFSDYYTDFGKTSYDINEDESVEIAQDAYGRRYYVIYNGQPIEDNSVVSVWYNFKEDGATTDNWIQLDTIDYTINPWENNTLVNWNNPAKVPVIVGGKTGSNFITDASVEVEQPFYILPYILDDGDDDVASNYIITLMPTDISDGAISDLVDHGYDSDTYKYFYQYTGDPIKPIVSVKTEDGATLVQGTDFDVYYGNTDTYLTTCGEKSLKVICKGNYSGSFTVPYVVWDSLSSDNGYITVDVEDQYYTGNSDKAEVTVKHDGITLTEDVDYKLTYTFNSDNTACAVKISAADGCIWYGYSQTVTYNLVNSIDNLIFKADGIDTSDTSKVNEIKYTGSVIRPAFTVTTQQGEAVEFTAEYLDKNGNALADGIPVEPSDTVYYIKVTVPSTNAYKTFKYKIVPRSIRSCVIRLLSKDYYADGAELTPYPTVTYNDNGSTVTLVRGTDYTLSYANNVNPGKATITITGEGTHYTGSAKVSFTIIPSAVDGLTISSGDVTTSAATIKWTGYNPSFPVSGYEVYVNGTDAANLFATIDDPAATSALITGLAEGSSNKIYVRSYLKLTVDGTEQTYYGDFSSITVDTKLGASSLYGISASTGKAYLEWNAQLSVDGYEVFYSTSENGKYRKKASVPSSSNAITLSATSGKTYYYKIRSYKLVNGSYVYGDLSEAVAIKIN